MRKAVGGGVPLEVGGLGANKCTANRILVAASVWALGTSFADRVYSVGQPGAKQCRHGTKAGDPSIELCVLCKAVVWRACKCGICVRVRVRGPRLVHRSTWVKNTHGGPSVNKTNRRRFAFHDAFISIGAWSGPGALQCFSSRAATPKTTRQNEKHRAGSSSRARTTLCVRHRLRDAAVVARLHRRLVHARTGGHLR